MSAIKKQYDARGIWLPIAFLVIFYVLIKSLSQYAMIHADVYTGYALYPQRTEYFMNVFTGQLLHSNFTHFFNNIIGFITLSLLIIAIRKDSLMILSILYVFSGLFLWAFAGDMPKGGRGLSAVIYAQYGFILSSGFFGQNPLATRVMIGAVVCCGYIWYLGIFDVNRVTAIAHAIGLLTGCVVAIPFIMINKWRCQIVEENL